MTVKKAINTNSGKESENRSDPSSIGPLLDRYAKSRGSLIPILQGIQKIYGYLPHHAVEAVAEATAISPSTIYGVATFYAQFRLTPVGKNIIRVCHGTACHVQNVNAVSQALVDELGVNDGETTADGVFTLETVACLGCCSLAPVMMIGEETFGNLTPAKAVRIIKSLRKNQQI